VPHTDVGWSPYFPLIAGLVTEIGGIVSHGINTLNLVCCLFLYNCFRGIENCHFS